MHFLYNLILKIVRLLLPILGFFNKKIKLFTSGRKNIFKLLEENINSQQSIVWVHAASLGEFEQGLPIIQKLRKKGYKILVTFFSPSGYEVKKNSKEADFIYYLPIDTPKNAQKFISIVKPTMAIFIKYEFWANYLTELQRNQIPTSLVSGIFRENQIFFKSYGKFMRVQLKKFTHLFVQNEESKVLLSKIDIQNVTVSGDTRFDRVNEILLRNNELSFMEEFTKNSKDCIVFGSSWPEDEKIYIPFINEYKGSTKFVIAPHNILPHKIQELKNNITKNVLLYSDLGDNNPSDYDVLIVDTIGILTKIYSYATIAYVGGGMGNTGLHNVLEPAVFGIPVIIGYNYNKFIEAKALVKEGGIISVSDEQTLKRTFSSLLKNSKEKIRVGKTNVEAIKNRSGATQIFIDFLERYQS